ncbi:unnamed protein product [Prorocentrum cordatum]|nr:unnamed protein product [Polarella glacialis]
MYHPMLFRTRMCCPHVQSIDTQKLAAMSLEDIDAKCKYGKYCAFAHFPEELRDSTPESDFCGVFDCTAQASPGPGARTLAGVARWRGPQAALVAAAAPAAGTGVGASCGGSWAAGEVPLLECSREPVVHRLDDPVDRFHVLHSAQCWAAMQKKAAESACSLRLGRAEQAGGALAVLVSGSNGLEAMVAVQSCIASRAWSDVGLEVVRFGGAVVAQIQDDVEKDVLKLCDASGERLFWAQDGPLQAKERPVRAGKPAVVTWLDFDVGRGMVTIRCGSSGGADSGACGPGDKAKAKKTAKKNSDLVQHHLVQVAERITSWPEKMRYSGAECMCCRDEKLTTALIRCRGDHYICPDPCFREMMRSQDPQLRAQSFRYTCPQCKQPFDQKEMAQHLDSATFEKSMSSVVDIRVSIQTERLQSDFDRKLQERMEQELAKYGDADSKIVQEAKEEARRIRNTILNLRCPGCDTVFFDFTGCMALQCEVCKQNFCAYCHRKCVSGYACHDHVRACEYNQTPNRSYYADEAQIRDAHRRYRQRELKQHLQQFKKQKQNAVVLELRKDLADVGIDPAGLLELGHIGPELAER